MSTLFRLFIRCISPPEDEILSVSRYFRRLPRARWFRAGCHTGQHERLIAKIAVDTANATILWFLTFVLDKFVENGSNVPKRRVRNSINLRAKSKSAVFCLLLQNLISHFLFVFVWLILAYEYRRSVAYYLSRAHSQS